MRKSTCKDLTTMVTVKIYKLKKSNMYKPLIGTNSI